MIKTKRQKQKEETRSKITQKAMDLISVHGFSVTTSQIAQAAGISHGSVFAHFSTREALLECVLAVFFDELNTRTHRAAKDASGIEGFLRVHLAVLGEYEGFYTHLVTGLISLPGQIANQLFAYQATLAYHFQQALSMEEKQTVAVPLHMLFNTWLALIHYYLQNKRMFAPHGSVIDRYREEWIESYLKMIKV